MAGDDRIRLHTLGKQGNPPSKGLRICLEGGEMSATHINGRVRAVKRQPTFITFVKGSAVVNSFLWTHLTNPETGEPVKTREQAVLAVKALPGYGTEFSMVENAVLAAGGAAK